MHWKYCFVQMHIYRLCLGLIEIKIGVRHDLAPDGKFFVECSDMVVQFG